MRSFRKLSTVSIYYYSSRHCFSSIFISISIPIFPFQLSRLLWHFVCVIVAERSLYRSNKQSKQTQRRRFIGHAWLDMLLRLAPADSVLDTTLRGCVHRRRLKASWPYLWRLLPLLLQLSSQKPKQISGELPRNFGKKIAKSKTKLCLHFY